MEKQSWEIEWEKKEERRKIEHPDWPPFPKIPADLYKEEKCRHVFDSIHGTRFCLHKKGHRGDHYYRCSFMVQKVNDAFPIGSIHRHGADPCLLQLGHEGDHDTRSDRPLKIPKL